VQRHWHALATAAAVLGFACSSPEAGEEGRTSPPDWFAEREPLPSCGRFVFEDFDEAPEEFVDMAECLLASFAAREPAELEVTDLTDEGDPVTTIYRVLDDGRLEMLTDWTEDELRPAAYTWSLCTDLELSPTGRLLPDDCAVVDAAEPRR
jgi:hypothetical protein